MSPENKKKLWEEILKAGEALKDKLPPSSSHPKGRNPYAHVALEIKNRFKNSYKDISDDKYEEVVLYIQYVRENPK